MKKTLVENQENKMIEVPDKCPKCGSGVILEEAAGRYVCAVCRFCFRGDGNEIKGGLYHGKK